MRRACPRCRAGLPNRWNVWRWCGPRIPPIRRARTNRPRAAQNTGDLPIASVARVLVAEDNVINQMLVRTLLELGNYEMLIVDNGRQAVAAAEAEIFDLILMDVRMPEMSGLEAARAIRGRKGLNEHTPILAMTANIGEAERRDCLDAGMSDLISKPIDRLYFLSRISEALGIPG
ncbi:response regulator [Hankyongella ginsenosidimutans]|uniref:Response regulator n=1 Tax=Hankyongella ginsenosidimutans TaxID=1763828 RepID=A0A4D7CBS8_9SPHN|nr:response regulator [Hankyongella ginsenosidimutans]